MAYDIKPPAKPKPISRVVQLGSALYALLPYEIRDELGLKMGDRLCMETDGRMIYAVKVPYEELMARKTRPDGGNVRVQVRPDGFVRNGKL